MSARPRGPVRALRGLASLSLLALAAAACEAGEAAPGGRVERPDGGGGTGGGGGSGALRDLRHLRLAMSAAGHGSLAWDQTAPAPLAQARGHAPGAGWGDARAIGAAGGSDVDVAIGRGADAPVAVWVARPAAGRWAVRSARLDAASPAWDAPTTLAESDAPLSGPRVAVDDRGRAVAVWATPPSPAGVPRPAVFVAHAAEGGRDWSPPERLAVAPVGVTSVRVVVAASGGGAAAVLLGYSDGDDAAPDSAGATRGLATLHATVSLPPAEGGPLLADDRAWSAPAAIGVGLGQLDVDSAALAIDATGDVLVVWTERGGLSTSAAFHRRFRVAGGWGPARPLPGEGGSTHAPRVAAGVVDAPWALVWVEDARPPEGTARIRAGRPGEDDDVAEELAETLAEGVVGEPRVAAGAAGGLLAVWVDRAAPAAQRILSRRWRAGVWEAAEPVAEGLAGVRELALVAGAPGRWHVAWIEGRASRNVVRTRVGTDGVGWSR